jgi:general secretion pathway protein N
VIRAGFFIATGIAAYFLILVFTLPAVQLEGFMEERVQGLSLSAVSGSVFYGEAGRASYQGTDLGSARWEFLPSALLTGRVEYHVGFSAPAGAGQANAGVTFAGNVYGHDIDVSFSPDQIIDRYSPVVVESSGIINVLVESFKLSDGFPHELTGRVIWKSAAILAPVEMVFGDTVLDLQNIGEELVGHIENEADFGLSGEVTIAPGGAYRVDLLLSPEAGASRQTISLLESTTTVQPGGNYLLHSSGQW